MHCIVPLLWAPFAWPCPLACCSSRGLRVIRRDSWQGFEYMCLCKDKFSYVSNVSARLQAAPHILAATAHQKIWTESRGRQRMRGKAWITNMWFSFSIVSDNTLDGILLRYWRLFSTWFLFFSTLLLLVFLPVETQRLSDVLKLSFPFTVI